jgi:serine/threonine protein kinase
MSFVPRIPSKAPLPAWLPLGRTLGGFYVLRPLGTGAGGSVFVARRAEQKNDEGAERFALKVPEYDGDAARTLSEQQFLDMFRDEAGALLSLPKHENLAGFVTFDAGASPKPILVMELVDGPTLERVITMADVDTARAFEVLEGIADGLMAMHEKGIAHLDVKPSNVILRDPDGLAGPEPARDAVLVDFGLAGRKIRPGCATGNYGAPEIWGAFGDATDHSPLPADVYAYGCVAYEMLTGRTLFDAPSPVALIANHFAHDGRPEPIDALAADPELEPLAAVLATALRHDPTHRATILDIKREIGRLRSRYAGAAWPLRAGARA